MNKWLLYTALFLGIVKGAPKTDDLNYTSCENEEFTYGCDYIGSSAKFRYYKCDSTDGKYTLTTTLDGLAEYTVNSDGSLDKKVNSNKVVQFTSQSWSWDTKENENYTITLYDENGNAISKSVKALCNTYNGELSVASTTVAFNFESCLISEDIEIGINLDDDDEENDEYLMIEASSLKWSVMIGDFPWQDETNDKLVLTVNYQVSGDDNYTFSGSDNENGYEYNGNIGVFDFDAPLYAYVEDTNGNITSINVSVVCTEQGNNKASCQFIFDSYDGTLYYDPVVKSEDDSSAVSILFNYFSFYLLAVAYLFF